MPHGYVRASIVHGRRRSARHSRTSGRKGNKTGTTTKPSGSAAAASRSGCDSSIISLGGYGRMANGRSSLLTVHSRPSGPLTCNVVRRATSARPSRIAAPKSGRPPAVTSTSRSLAGTTVTAPGRYARPRSISSRAREPTLAWAAMLVCLSSRLRWSVFEEPVEVAGEVALEAAGPFASGLWGPGRRVGGGSMARVRHRVREDRPERSSRAA